MEDRDLPPIPPDRDLGTTMGGVLCAWYGFVVGIVLSKFACPG